MISGKPAQLSSGEDDVVGNDPQWLPVGGQLRWRFLAAGAAVAAGLACYGLYCLVEARYRDLTPGR